MLRTSYTVLLLLVAGCQFDTSGVPDSPDETSPDAQAPLDASSPSDAPVIPPSIPDAQPEPDANRRACLNNPAYAPRGANGHRYRAVSLTAVWSNASSACQDDDAYLIVIDDNTENDDIRGLLPGSARWIGLSDSANEGTFAWVTGEPLDFENWNAGSNNSEASDCAAMQGNNGRWDATDCDTPLPFVCECDPDYVPR